VATQEVLVGATVTDVLLTAVIMAGPAAVGSEMTVSPTRKPSVAQPVMAKVVDEKGLAV
jgi:hypothetical protein